MTTARSPLLPRSTSARTSLLLAGALVLACGGGPPATPEETVTAAAQSPAATGGKATAPKIAVAAPVFDFGAVGTTDAVTHVFEIRNVGDADLKVERVQKT